jgi:hypothetical protein
MITEITSINTAARHAQRNMKTMCSIGAMNAAANKAQPITTTNRKLVTLNNIHYWRYVNYDHASGTILKVWHEGAAQ